MDFVNLEQMQVSQIETYKSQILNLKKQLALFEQKFEQMEADRKQAEARTNHIARETINQMEGIERDKDQLIVRLQEDVEHLSKIIHKLEGELNN